MASQAEIISRPAVASAGAVASVAISFTQNFAVSLTKGNNEVIGIRKHLTGVPNNQLGDHRVDFGGRNFRGNIHSVAKEIDRFRESLSIEESRFATSANIIKIREEFTEELTNTLQVGADNLVLANLNLEGARMASLRTRSGIATQSLAIASQQAQQVLRILLGAA